MREERMDAGLRLGIAEIELGFAVLAGNGVDGAEIHGFERVDSGFVSHAASDGDVVTGIENDYDEDDENAGPLQDGDKKLHERTSEIADLMERLPDHYRLDCARRMSENCAGERGVQEAEFFGTLVGWRHPSMAKLIHESKVKIHKEAKKKKIKVAQFEGFPDVVRMGVHGGVAEHFKVQPDEPLPTTLDYVVAAIGGCMTGTAAGVLESRGVNADPENLEVEATGKIEEVDGKMLLTGVTLKYKIKVPKDKRASVERALEHHEGFCAVSESVKRGISVAWTAEIEDAVEEPEKAAV